MTEFTLGIQGFNNKVSQGTNLILSGPPLTGKTVLSRRFFYESIKSGNGGIYVSTTKDAKSLLDWFKNKNLNLSNLDGKYGIVDCVSESQDLAKPENDDFIKYASSPVALTDIGVKISHLIKNITQQNSTNLALCLDSASVMLLYSELKTVFRFLHTFCGRIRSIGGVGMFILEEGSHDDKTIKTIKQLMDASIETRENNEDREIKINGENLNLNWAKYEISNNQIELRDI